MQAYPLKRVLFSILAAGLFAATGAQAQYLWSGNGANGNWNNKTNWGGTSYPQLATDIAIFSNATPQSPIFTANSQFGTLQVNGSTNWTWTGSTTVTNCQVFSYGSSSTNASVFTAPTLAGTGGVTVTSGYLILGNIAHTYTGPTLVQGGILDATAASVNLNANSPVGNSATPIQVGGNAVNAELRLGPHTSNRGITIQNGGTGTNTVRFTGAAGSTENYTNSIITLNTNVVFAPDFLTTTFNSGSIYNIGTLTGPGSIIVGGGVNTITFGSSSNTYTGSVSVDAGILSVPSFLLITNTASGSVSNHFGNQQVFLGDVAGTNNATLQFGAGVTKAVTNFFTQALTVNSGSTGLSALDFSLTSLLSSYLMAPMTLNKTLSILCGHGGPVVMTNTFSGMGGLNIAAYNLTAGAVPGTQSVAYNLASSPGYAGGTTLSGLLGSPSYLYGMAPLQWNYPGSTGDNTLLRFGSSNSAPSAITLNGGQYSIYSTTGVSETYSNDNPIVVAPNNYVGSGYPAQFVSPNCNYLEWGFAGTNGVMSFTGPITLGNTLRIGDLSTSVASVGHYSGTVTIDQSTGGRRGFWINQKAFTALTLDGNIIDGTTGTAANSLILRAVTVTGPINLTGTGSTFANGTVVDGDFSPGSIFNITSSSGSLGLGNIWVLEGGQLQLNQSGHLASGASMTLYGNQAAMSVLGLGGNFLPQLTSDSFGVLAINTNNYTAIADQSKVGNGLMYLGSANPAGCTLTAPTLKPCSDGIYRLGGACGELIVPNGALTSVTSPLQVGAPCSGSSLLVSATNANGNGSVFLQSANTYSGTVVNANCTLYGQAQTSGSPFGNTNAPVTLNGGILQLYMINAPTTNTIGPLKVNGFSEMAIYTFGQSLTQTVLQVANMPLQSATAPWSLTLLGRTGNGDQDQYLGGKLRIVVTGTPPAVSNGMVLPNILLMGALTANDCPDFLTYNNNIDSTGGVVGFTNANSAYTTITGTNLDTLQSGTAIASITGITLTNSGADNVYALRLTATCSGITNANGSASITVGNGGILQGGSITPTIYENICFSNAPGFIYNGNTLTITGSLAGTNGLVKTGSAKLLLKGANTFTGTVAVIGGSLSPATDQAFGVAANPLYLDAGAALLFGFSGTENRPITIGPGGGGLACSAGAITLGGPLTGTGVLTIYCYGVGFTGTLTNQNNTYSGGTLISGGGNSLALTLSVASNSTLGVGDVAIVNTLWTGTYNNEVYFYGDRNIGGGDYYSSNPTTNRQARLSIEPCCQACFMSANPSVGSLSGSGNIYLTNTTLSVGGDNTSTIFDGYLYQWPGSTGQLYKTGSGLFVFKGVSLLAGTNVVNSGTLEVDGAVLGSISVNTGATLQGAGSVGVVTLNSGSTFLPGIVTNAPTITTNSMHSLSASSLTMASGSTVIITVNSATDYTQINGAGGSINLGSSTLQVNVNPSYVPKSTDTFNIITNDTITGTFAGLPNNHSVSLGNSYQAQISYGASSVTLTGASKGASGTAMYFW